MADRYPLVYNSSANQLQELQSGDSLDVGNSSIKGATGYATTTGTSSQFLKADGSTDSNTYLTSTGTVALAEGLTGSPSINVSAVSGTTGTFSGAVSGTNGTFSGNVSVSSSITAATFYGDGSQLSGISVDSTSLKSGSDIKVQAVSTGADVTGNLGVSGNATITGNLTVNGTTTTIDTAVTEVDSLAVDGSVGIGTTNPGNFNGNADDLVVFGTGHQGLTIRSGTAHDGSIMFNDTDDANQRGIIRYIHTDDAMAFHTSGGEAVRITSSGNIGIGTDTPSKKLEVSVGNSVSDGILVKGNSSPVIKIDEGSGVSANFGLDGNGSYFGPTSNHYQVFRTNSVERLRITSGGNVGINSTAPTGILDVGGNILPDADNTRDLGSASKRWANIYTGDLNLSNEGSANDVDGTWGQYTIQEGEDDLFLINRRTGKKYKFNLTEVN